MTKEICQKDDGTCICKDNVDGDKCEKCVDGFYPYPECNGGKIFFLSKKNHTFISIISLQYALVMQMEASPSYVMLMGNVLANSTSSNGSVTNVKKAFTIFLNVQV